MGGRGHGEHSFTRDRYDRARRYAPAAAAAEAKNGPVRPARAWLVVLDGGPLDGCTANMRFWEANGGVMPVAAAQGRYVFDSVTGSWSWERDAATTADPHGVGS